MRKFPLYIPAGSDPTEEVDPLLQTAGVKNKAFIKLNEKHLIEYVIEAADEAETIERIFIVGIEEKDIVYQPTKKIDYIPSVGSRMDTLKNLMVYLEKEYDGQLPQHLAVLSADIPLISGEIIDKNINNLQDEFGEDFDNINLFYPLVPKGIVIQHFANANKRYRKFTEGTYATGDFVIFSPSVLRDEKTLEVTEKIMESRKTMARLLLKFDIFAPIKYLIGRLSIRQGVIPFMNEYVGIKMELLISEDPEICIDLDYPEDLTVIEDLVKNS